MGSRTSVQCQKVGIFNVQQPFLNKQIITATAQRERKGHRRGGSYRCPQLGGFGRTKPWEKEGGGTKYGTVEEGWEGD
jgi:hypothetical protein